MKTPLLQLFAIITLTLLPLPSSANDDTSEPPRFFETLNDIPLMTGMEELTEQAVVFDKAEGRIIESSAITEIDNIDHIRAFYDTTLPQLGWQKTSSDIFIRNDETLRFSIHEQAPYKIIRFTVAPR